MSFNKVKLQKDKVKDYIVRGIERESINVPQSNTFPGGNSQTYVLNINSKKIHYPSCSSVIQMNESNKKIVNDTVENLKIQGYRPCGRCNPK